MLSTTYPNLIFIAVLIAVCTGLIGGLVSLKRQDRMMTKLVEEQQKVLDRLRSLVNRDE